MKRNTCLVLLLAACVVLPGCGGGSSMPSVSAQRDVAQRFARAIFSGRVEAAVALLVHPDEDGLSWRVARAAAPWRAHPAAVRLSGPHRGNQWVFRYTGTHTHRDGRFEQVRGDLAVVVVASPKGAGVEYFTFLDETTRYGTHHDSVLLPSNR